MKLRSMRGPNWVEASVSVTIVIENTSVTTVITAAAIAVRICRAASALPLITNDGRVPAFRRRRRGRARRCRRTARPRARSATVGTATGSCAAPRAARRRARDPRPHGRMLHGRRHWRRRSAARVALEVDGAFMAGRQRLPTRLPGSPPRRVTPILRVAQKCPPTASSEIRRVSSGAGRRIRISAGTRSSSQRRSS